MKEYENLINKLFKIADVIQEKAFEKTRTPNYIDYKEAFKLAIEVHRALYIESLTNFQPLEITKR